jgi:uncharacterized protein YhjY with autotransporter beta-barrel domain
MTNGSLTTATVSFSALTGATNTGGAAITGYAVTSNPAGGMDTNAGSTGTSHLITGLTAGTAYTFAVVATNINGPGAASNASSAVTPLTVPAAPSIGTATLPATSIANGSAQATVSFTALSGAANTGGTPITGYSVVSTPAGGVDSNAGQTGTSHLITGLIAGTAYTFKVTATNGVGAGGSGTGNQSGASNSVTPLTAPAAPIIGVATRGNAQATVTFTAPTGAANIGGTAVTGYTVVSSPAGGTDANAGTTPTSHTVTGLTNGTSYTFTVTATNGAGLDGTGTGSASTPSLAVTPATIPGAPTVGTVTGGNAQATVAFISPASNGGDPITGYTVTSNGGQIATGTTSPITVVGLTNGTAYTFTVVATNGVGTGSASTASASVTPATVPGAPTGVTATKDNVQATVTFTAPNNGGAVITGYTVTSNPAGGVDSNAGSTALTHLVTGLVNGTPYTFNVTATTSAGTGGASVASNSVTPSTVPSGSTSVTATPGNAQASVTFTAPNNGGAPVTGYTVTSIPAGGVDSNAGTTGLTHAVTGLVNGTVYTFTVTATNLNGAGAASTASNSVTPATIPNAPSNVTAVAGNSQATVTFTAPSNGGSPILTYTATAAPGGQQGSCSGPVACTITVTGLSNGTAYTFTVVAINSTGSSVASASSNTVTPASPPGAPGISSVMVGNGLGSGQAIVFITAPASTGGAAITGYTVISHPAGGVDSNAGTLGSFHTITGLTDHTAYTFTVVAINSIGTGVESSASGSYTPEAPPVAIATKVTVPYNSTAFAITPQVTGTVNVAGLALVSSPIHGTATVSTTNNTVSYTPNSGYYGSDSFNFTVSGPGGTSVPALVSITVGNPPPPTVTDAAMTTTLNNAQTLDLAPNISGIGVTGIFISTQPKHGTASVSGTKVTYVPTTDYFGIDTFKYKAYGVAQQTSDAATVTVTITGRPDPLKDARVTGLVNIQTTAALRFGKAQVFNFQQRLESRHHASFDTLAPASPGVPAPIGGALPEQNRGYFNSWQPDTAFTYANDPNTLIHSPNRMDGTTSGNADPMSMLLANVVKGVVASDSINLAQASNALGAGQEESFSRLELWAAGNLRFGTRSQAGVDTRFNTDGVSIGVDKRLNRRLTVGMGIGYGQDKSVIGTDGTNSASKGSSVAGYASYQFDRGTFIDGLIGAGKVNFDTNRYVTSVNDFARAARTGDQLFGSFSFGYDYRKDGLLWSPYGRYDLSVNRLNSATESGAGLNALNYAAQSVRNSQVSFGLRAQSQHQTDFGVVQPRVRFEYQHGIETNGQTSISYADLLDTQYMIAATTKNQNSMVLGLGSDFLPSDTLKLTFDYQRLRSGEIENYQSLNFRVTKSLYGKNDLQGLLMESYASSINAPTGLVVAAGFAYDDNVTRASNALDKLSDSIYSLTLSKAKTFNLTKHTRLSVSGFMDVEKFKNYAGLGHVSAGAQADYKFRFSGDFGSPTFGVFARLTADQYESTLRDGSRSSVGLNLSTPLTDRINLFSALASNSRKGKSDVFNIKDISARANLDYELTGNQTLFLTGEYRKGDIVSTGHSNLAAFDITTVYWSDDVFSGMTDYRTKGHTSILTFGYNFALGAKDSIDVTWRHISTLTDKKPAFLSAPLRYDVNQLSFSYLMAF